jgi:hypothetical protein
MARSLTDGGFEAGGEFDVTADSTCDWDFCQGYRAANALHSGRSNCAHVAPLNANLQRVIAVWDSLPKNILAAIVALAETAGT